LENKPQNPWKHVGLFRENPGKTQWFPGELALIKSSQWLDLSLLWRGRRGLVHFTDFTWGYCELKWRDYRKSCINGGWWLQLAMVSCSRIPYSR
jgi:hypothetical protein